MGFRLYCLKKCTKILVKRKKNPVETIQTNYNPQFGVSNFPNEFINVNSGDEIHLRVKAYGLLDYHRKLSGYIMIENYRIFTDNITFWKQENQNNVELTKDYYNDGDEKYFFYH